MGRPPLPPGQRKPRLSGAQREKLKHQAQEVERKQVVAKARDLGVDVHGEDDEGSGDDSWALEFQEAGEPDLENPETDLFYVRKLQLIALRQMATTARPSKSQQDCWRRIREMSAVVGMTSPRAALEAKLKQLEAKLNAVRSQTGTANLEAADGVPRPTTARGRRGARGPRPVPGHGAGPASGKDA